MRGAILAVVGLIVALPLGAAFATDDFGRRKKKTGQGFGRGRRVRRGAAKTSQTEQAAESRGFRPLGRRHLLRGIRAHAEGPRF